MDCDFTETAAGNDNRPEATRLLPILGRVGPDGRVLLRGSEAWRPSAGAEATLSSPDEPCEA